MCGRPYPAAAPAPAPAPAPPAGFVPAFAWAAGATRLTRGWLVGSRMSSIFMGRSVSGDKVVARLGERDHDQFGVHRGRISVETAKSSTSAAHPPLKAITHPNEFRDSHLQTIFLLKVLVLMETTNKSLQGLRRTDRRWPHSDQPRSAGNLASWSDP